MFFIATTTVETPPLLAIEFLHRMCDIFEEYFNVIDENTFKDNFATVYQLLEEMMDFGYPLTTEPNALKDMITLATTISRYLSIYISIFFLMM
jgi:AP-3 complex subunit mu